MTKQFDVEIEALKTENARLREALTSIACNDLKMAHDFKYWLRQTHAECAEVCAKDTEIARAALEGKE